MPPPAIAIGLDELDRRAPGIATGREAITVAHLARQACEIRRRYRKHETEIEAPADPNEGCYPNNARAEGLFGTLKKELDPPATAAPYASISRNSVMRSFWEWTPAFL